MISYICSKLNRITIYFSCLKSCSVRSDTNPDRKPVLWVRTESRRAEASPWVRHLQSTVSVEHAMQHVSAPLVRTGRLRTGRLRTRTTYT